MIAAALLAAVLIGCAIALVVRGLSLPRVRTVRSLEQIAAYGFTSSAIADATFDEKPTLVSGIGSAIAPRIGRERVKNLRRQLLSAGLHGMSAETYLGYHALAVVGGALAGIWFGVIFNASPGWVVIWALVGVGLGYVLPPASLARKARTRLDEIDYEIPELVDLLLVGIESGMAFNGAMRVASTRILGPLGEELRLMLQQQSLGASTTEALESLLERGDTPAVRSFVRTIVQGERLGVSIGHMMRSLAEEMRKRRKATAEERAQKTPVKLVFPLATTLLPAMMIIVLTPAAIRLLDTFDTL